MDTARIDIKDIRKIYFLGIGGIGMSALARYFSQSNIIVYGYDKTPSDITLELEKTGIAVHYEARTDLITEDTGLVIYTPAIPSDFEELQYIKQENIPLIKRSDALSLLIQGKKCIAVSGTHGKTSTSAMLAHIWACSDKPFLGFIGGIVKQYNSNLFLHPDAETVIVEADEYDRSFLKIFADTAIVNAADPDHLDIYGTHEELKKAFVQFLSQSHHGAPLLVQEKVELDFGNMEISRFGWNSKSPFRIENLRTENGYYIADMIWGEKGEARNIRLAQPGRHNAMNALAASSAAILNGISPEIIRNALETFPGVQRRFEYIIRNEKMVFIDDYAHHPDEINALLDTVLELYPGKKIVGVFQPHLYTRTRDLADGFAKALSRLPVAVLLDIYPAREEPIEGITSEWLMNQVDAKEKHLVSKENLCKLVRNLRADVVLTIGAGDIDRMVQPLKKTLEEPR